MRKNLNNVHKNLIAKIKSDTSRIGGYHFYLLMVAQSSLTAHISYWDAIYITPIQTKINFIAPDFIAIDIWVDVPGDAMCIIYVQPAKVFKA